jgi:hypothetical protein
MFSPNKPLLQAVNMNLFPAMESIDAVINYCKAEFREEDSQKVLMILMTYHNTLLNQINH